MENPRPTAQGGTLNMEYIKSLEGLLKLAEIVGIVGRSCYLSAYDR